MGYDLVTLKIEGLRLTPLNQISDERGAVFHFLKSDIDTFKGFGEAYFSKINEGIVKGWKLHTIVHQHFCVPFGKVKIVIYDGREDSISFGKIDVIILDDCINYNLLSMPKGLWYSFKCESPGYALLANIIDNKHQANESENLDLNNNHIPYEWQ